MSEPTTQDAAPTNPTAPQGEPAADLGEGGKKALDAERAARKAAEKAASDLQAKLDEIGRSNESLIEKAQREAQEAREALPAGITSAFRDAAVTFGGIPAEDADLFLTGSDVDTLKRQAQRLVERTPASTGPKPDLTQGGHGQPLALNGDGLEEALKTKLGI